MINDYIREQENTSEKKRTPIREDPRQHESVPQNEALRRSKYHRDAKGIDGTYLLNILEEIVIKEERL